MVGITSLSGVRGRPHWCTFPFKDGLASMASERAPKFCTDGPERLVPRDLLPLPRLGLQSRVGGLGGRSASQRAGRRRAVDFEVDRTISALNGMFTQ